MSFDKSIAIEAAELIHALYRGGIAPTINDKHTDTQVLVRRESGRTLVIFPGTDSVKDWQTDFRAAKVDWHPGGKAHAGFVSAVNSVFDLIVKQIGDAQNVIVAGHSLGGALAMLAADALMWEDGIIAESVYTFGAPRVGNGAFTRHFNANLHDETFRIVNEHDPVPYLPPWMMGYRHAGTEVFLGTNSLTVDRSWWDQGVDTWNEARNRAATPDAKNFVSVSAHSINSYINKLKGQQG